MLKTGNALVARHGEIEVGQRRKHPLHWLGSCRAGSAADWWGRIAAKGPALLWTRMPSQAEVPTGSALVPVKVQPVTFCGSMAAPQAGTETHDSSREATTTSLLNESGGTISVCRLSICAYARGTPLLLVSATREASFLKSVVVTAGDYSQ